MHGLSLTSGAFAVPPMARLGFRARAGRVVPFETVRVGVEPGANRWRLRRGCSTTFEVYDARGAYLGQVVAPCDPAVARFGGDTVYLDRTHLAVLRD